MDNKKLKIIFAVAAAASLGVAILLLVLGIALSVPTLPKVVMILMAVVAFALAGELGYFAFMTTSSKPNYFLYDSRLKRNISVQKLTFATVNSKMNKFLSNYASSEGKLWNDRVFDNPYVDIPAEFKPLIAYKMLYSLAEKDVEAGWRCLEASSEATVSFICDGLLANGDSAFAEVIAQINERPMNIKAARDYLVKNKKYMQGKMTKYVIDNIDLFS